MTNIAEIYGGSLYDLSAEENIEESVLAGIEAAAEIFRREPDYIRLLNEPSISRADRVRLIDEAFGGHIHHYLLNFMKLLCEEGRISEFTGCAVQFRKRYDSAHNISEAVVTSAFELSEEQSRALRSRLEKVSGRTVRLIRKTDEKCIAGIRVQLDGVLYDGTVSGRLDAVKRKITDI